MVSVALTKAKEFGIKVAAAGTTGNLGNAVAAHAAKAGMPAVIFMPHDLEIGKIVPTAVYGATIVSVKGNYDDVNRLCAEVADAYDWAFVNTNVRAFYSEGSKTLAFEVVEQLGWKYPEHIVVPIGSGSQLVKVRKGLDELNKVRLMPAPPHTQIHGAQALGCSPVAQAFLDGVDHVRPVKPDTIAKSIAIGNPADGPYALQAIRETGGRADTVTEGEIVEAILLLARTEGIFTETAGGVTIGVLAKLAAADVFAPGERVVALVTGMGLKTIEAVSHSAKPVTITPSMDEFEEKIELGLIPNGKAHSEYEGQDPDAAAQAHAEQRGGRRRRRDDPRARRRSREAVPRLQGADVRRPGRAAPLRERLRRRGGHPLPRRPRHEDPRGRAGLDHPGRRRRLSSRASQHHRPGRARPHRLLVRGPRHVAVALGRRHR